MHTSLVKLHRLDGVVGLNNKMYTLNCVVEFVLLLLS